MPVEADLFAAGGMGGTSCIAVGVYMVCLLPAIFDCRGGSHLCTGALASASLVPYCKLSIAFTGGVFDLSDDRPRVNAERPNLDLDPERSRFEFGGGGGKFIGISLRLLVDIGDCMTVTALGGVETSLARCEGVRRLLWRWGGDRASGV